MDIFDITRLIIAVVPARQVAALFVCVIACNETDPIYLRQKFGLRKKDNSLKNILDNC